MQEITYEQYKKFLEDYPNPVYFNFLLSRFPEIVHLAVGGNLLSKAVQINQRPRFYRKNYKPEEYTYEVSNYVFDTYISPLPKLKHEVDKEEKTESTQN